MAIRTVQEHRKKFLAPADSLRMPKTLVVDHGESTLGASANFHGPASGVCPVLAEGSLK